MHDANIIEASHLAAHRYQCHHVFPDGARCGSPSLRNENRCYYHHETRRPVTNPRERNARLNTLEMPVPDTRTNIQAALGDIFSRIATNDIDHRRAGLLLYCLQLASNNLKSADRAAQHQQTQPKPTTPSEASSPDNHQPTAPHPNPAAEPEPRISITDQPIDKPARQDDPNPPEVQTEPSSLEDFTQKPGEGTPSHLNPSSEPSTPSPSLDQDRRISRPTFAALLETLARHHGISVEDLAYTQHHFESPILATLRAEADTQPLTCWLALQTPCSLPASKASRIKGYKENHAHSHRRSRRTPKALQ